MKDHPILFNGDMVRAILEDRKTRTWRAMRPQPWKNSVGQWLWGPNNLAFWPEINNFGPLPSHCPFGQSGDRLWVRESFQPLLAKEVKWNNADYEMGDGYAPNYVATSPVVEFVDCAHDDEITARVTPSIHMPRWASRITLENCGVKVQRLLDTTEAEAIAEGFGPRSARALFLGFWPPEIIAANPWGWAVSFKVARP